MIKLHDKFGVINLAEIDPTEIEKLNDAQQALLATLFDKVRAREAAQTRYSEAVIRVSTATQEQIDAHAAHIEASQPFPFVLPKEIEGMTDAKARASATAEARENHDRRVRQHREADARKAAIAAYNSSH